MAAMNFAPISLRPPEFTFGNSNYRNSVTFIGKRRTISVSLAVNSQESAPVKPEIELEFIGPEAGGDGVYPVERATEISGEKLLRNIMLDNKIELYATYGKVMNCGGGGSCGTCIVEIIDGKDLLNERMNAELRYLKKACTASHLPLSLNTLKRNLLRNEGDDEKLLRKANYGLLVRLMKVKPESWRLACQTIVGNKENSGKVVVQRLPQWKK